MRNILPWMSVNGTIVSQTNALVSALDDGFQYGYGCFTTLKVREGIPLFFERHVKRLTDSAKVLDIEIQNSERLATWVRDSIEKNDITEGAIRITVTKGSGEHPSIIIHATTIDTAMHTVPVITVPDTRDMFKTIKMTYRVPHIIAMRQAQRQGAQDALFVSGGNLIESTYANIYSYTPEGKIVTPPIARRALDSISRKVLMEQLPLKETEVSLDTEQPMVLVSSLSMRVVQSINGREITQHPEFVLQMQHALERAEMHDIAAHKK